MVSLSVVQACNIKVASLTRPITAVFVGGTRGIGRATLLELAQRKTIGLKIYIVGRNLSSQQVLLDRLRLLSPKGEYIFLEAQISQLAEVKRVCDEIKLREHSLDLLWLSSGALPFDGRKETCEGLSMHMSLGYWSRMFFTTLLIPLLKVSSANPRVVSILRAGQESPELDLDDLDIKKFTTKAVYIDQYAAAAETMNTLFLERLAEQNPEIVFVHKFPGLVKSDLFSQGWGTTWSIKRVLFTYVVPRVVTLIGLSETEVGERCVFTLFSAQYGGEGVQIDGQKALRNSKGGTGHEGVFLVKENDEAVVNDKTLALLRKRDASQIIYEETHKTFAPYL